MTDNTYDAPSLAALAYAVREARAECFNADAAVKIATERAERAHEVLRLAESWLAHHSPLAD